jgi:ribose transport system substrate-binding protein
VRKPDSWQNTLAPNLAALMRLPLLRTCLFAPLLLLLSSCGPEDPAAGDPFAQHQNDRRQAENASATQAGFRPPPELMQSMSQAADEAKNLAEIVLLQPQGTHAFQQYQRGLLNFLASRQKGLKITSEDAKGSSSSQIAQLVAAVKRKPAAILLDPVDGADFSAALADAAGAGVRVIGLSARAEGCPVIIHCDPAEIGAAAARVALEALQRKAQDEGRTEVTGRVVQLRGPETSRESDAITTGFETGLRAQPGVILVHDGPTDGNRLPTFFRLVEAFNIQKQFDVIFLHDDAAATETARFTTEHKIRETTLIIGTGGLPGPTNGMELLRLGEIDADIARPPLVDLALSLVLKQRAEPSFVPKERYTIPPVAVTPKSHPDFSRSRAFELPAL